MKNVKLFVGEEQAFDVQNTDFIIVISLKEKSGSYTVDSHVRGDVNPLELARVLIDFMTKEELLNIENEFMLALMAKAIENRQRQDTSEVEH